MEKKDILIKIQNLIIYFFICSFFGWLLEVTYAFSVYGTYIDRGFLKGPICPIYGYAAIAMILTIEWIKKKKIHNIFVIFIFIIIIATAIEYITSLFLELIFHLRWWDYTGYFLNINGRVCFIFSVFFGIAGIIFMNIIYPKLQKLTKKIRKYFSNKNIWIILIGLIIIMIIDQGLSSFTYWNFNLENVDFRVVLKNN